MRFKKFLIEEEKKDPMNHLIGLLTGEYSDAYNSKTALFRGLKNGISKFYEIRTKEKFTTARYERGTKPINLETIFEICPEWKKFPDRSNSLIMSKSLSEAKSFGPSNIVRVFPINGAKLGIAPTDFNYYRLWPMMEKFELTAPHFDFAQAFIPQLYLLSLEEFELDKMIQSIGYVSNAKNWFDLHHKKLFAYFKKTYIGEDIVKKYKQLEKENEIMKKFHNADETIFLEILKREFNGDLEKMCETLFSPEKNDFHIITTDQIDKFATKEMNELWTSDPCLIIQPEAYDVIVDIMKRKKK